jgi:hypothetical protein
MEVVAVPIYNDIKRLPLFPYNPPQMFNVRFMPYMDERYLVEP